MTARRPAAAHSTTPCEAAPALRNQGFVLDPASSSRAPRGAAPAPRLLFVVNADWFFLSHRLPLALGARRAGLRVTVAAADTGNSGPIRDAGLDFVPLRISRDGTGVVSEFATLASLARLYHALAPDIIHHVTIKPVLYGSLAARTRPGTAVVNAISGLGYVFSSGEGRTPVLRVMAEAGYRMALGGARTRTIFQNPEDRDQFVRKGLVRESSTLLIRGSGVDPERFRPLPVPEGPPVVMLASRMLWEKGVGEFVEAARRLRSAGIQARFVLAGGTDPGNPTSVQLEQLQAWNAEGVVEWWGHRGNMAEVLAQASLVVLPSYYKEGLPKVLLEAAASGRAMIASDIPGCREIVLPGRTGVLIPPRDPGALAVEVERLLADPALRARYGAAARALAESEFTEQHVVRQTLDLYRELLGPRWPSPPGEE